MKCYIAVQVVQGTIGRITKVAWNIANIEWIPKPPPPPLIPANYPRPQYLELIAEADEMNIGFNRYLGDGDVTYRFEASFQENTRERARAYSDNYLLVTKGPIDKTMSIYDLYSQEFQPPIPGGGYIGIRVSLTHDNPIYVKEEYIAVADSSEWIEFEPIE